MALPLYLAMTAAEMRAYTPHPKHFGYMAVHFSPYSTGLSDFPRSLREGCMLILNDRIPWHGHDAGQIISQLKDLCQRKKCESLLLDFQRPGTDALHELTCGILKELPCPVGVSHLYAEDLPCPVFLPPVKLNTPITKYLAPWKGREIWLEAALDGCEMTLTEQGCKTLPLPYPERNSGHRDSGLLCHYCIETAPKKAVFTLFRTREDLSCLLEEAAGLGVARAVGLWQELGEY